MYFFSIPVLFGVFFQQFEKSKQENVDVFGFVNCKHVRRSGGSTSPNSFSITANFILCSVLVRMWFSRVVLPEPRKPVNTVTGMRLFPSTASLTAMSIEIMR